MSANFLMLIFRKLFLRNLFFWNEKATLTYLIFCCILNVSSNVFIEPFWLYFIIIIQLPT